MKYHGSIYIDIILEAENEILADHALRAIAHEAKKSVPTNPGVTLMECGVSVQGLPTKAKVRP